jgi:bacterioferritin-associated ferredoxin
MDAAMCNKRRRPAFLQLISTKVLLFNREEIIILEDPYNSYSYTHKALGTAALSWVLKRGIHLASLRLPPRRVLIAVEHQFVRDVVASLALDGHLDKLETISFHRCSYINDADLAGILSKCFSSVNSIDIRECNVTGSSTALIKRCTKLDTFKPRRNESAADLAEIFESCRKMRKVDLGAFGELLIDEVLRSMAAHCPLLENLSISGCREVSDESIRKVADSCPFMQWINLSFTAITDASVVSLCTHCPLLKRLYLHYCSDVTDVAVLAVAARLPGLTHIDLFQIPAITSSAVEALALKCRELEFIVLSYCSNITDATLTKIAGNCSKLQELRVRWCSKVTATGLAEIALKCTNLKTISVNYELKASIRQAFPNLRVINR